MRRLLAAALLCLLPGLAEAYELTHEMVSMRDGTRLDTEILRPSKPGRYPTILMRTPYSMMAFGDEAARLLADGLQFVVVQQSTRGRYASEGTDDVFLSDGWGENQDGFDTVEWIVSQSWSDRKVGLFGVSALGITSYLNMGAMHPAIKAAHVGIAPWVFYNVVYPGGEFRTALLEDWLGGQGSAYMIDLYKQHPIYDDFWTSLDMRTRQDHITVPILHWGGWHDVFTEGPVEGFEALQHGGASGRGGFNRLVMGPWTHVDAGPFDTRQGELVYPGNSYYPMGSANPIEWFQEFLKGRAQRPPADLDAYPVRYYLMGPTDQERGPGNHWELAREWPVPATQVPLYFGTDGSLGWTAPAGASLEPLSWLYDPADPSPTIGGHELTIPQGPRDQSPLLARSDVLHFETAPLDRDVKIVGKVRATLYASSTAPDTDFVARLVDVYPDGRAMLVTDGVIRARYRDSMTQPEFLVPGQIYAFDIDLNRTAQVFGKGHRIMVLVSSSNYRRYEPAKNTQDDIWGSQPAVTAVNSLYADARYPSGLLLPVPKPGAVVPGFEPAPPSDAAIGQAMERMKRGAPLSAADQAALREQGGRELMHFGLRAAGIEH